jgi:hypothetical protein
VGKKQVVELQWSAQPLADLMLLMTQGWMCDGMELAERMKFCSQIFQVAQNAMSSHIHEVVLWPCCFVCVG